MIDAHQLWGLCPGQFPISFILQIGSDVGCNLVLPAYELYLRLGR